MKLRGPLITALILALLVTLVVLGIHRDNYLNSAFDNVSIGISQTKVKDVMSTPRWSEGCRGGDAFTANVPDKCVETDVYASSFAPFPNPEYWVIFYDRDRRVIDKAHLQSP